jgi:hypothetical protein
VAENQPFKNRVNTTTSFSEFSAQLRELIRCGDTQRFDSIALELFALQFEHNHAYRTFCEATNARPDTVRHWAHIPAVPTAGFKELELTCLKPDQRTTVFHSSGTTGQSRSCHFHSAESLRIYETSLLGWFGANVEESGDATLSGLKRQDDPQPGVAPSSKPRAELCNPFRIERRAPMIFLTPPLSQAPNSSLVYMFETVRHEFGSASSNFFAQVASNGDWTLDSEAVVRHLEEVCSAQQPVCLLGTAFSFVHLLDHLQNHGKRFKLPAGSIALETGGYKGKTRSLPRSELHNLISSRLGILHRQIICEYGMSELSSQAYSRVSSRKKDKPHSDIGRQLPVTPDPRPSTLFHFPPWARAQMISPETGREVADGETGLIRVFDLANVYSVMAIQTEDLAIKHGDGFELLGRAALAEPRGCSLMSVATQVRAVRTNDGQ